MYLPHHFHGHSHPLIKLQRQELHWFSAKHSALVFLPHSVQGGAVPATWQSRVQVPTSIGTLRVGTVHDVIAVAQLLSFQPRAFGGNLRQSRRCSQVESRHVQMYQVWQTLVCESPAQKRAKTRQHTHDQKQSGGSDRAKACWYPLVRFH